MNHKFAIAVAALAVAIGLTVSHAAYAQEMLTNPGFETGDFTGWTQFGNTGFSGVTGAPHTGNFGAFFGPVGSMGFISQDLATIPGAAYKISWWLGNYSGTSTSNEFSVTAGGDTLVDLFNLASQPYLFSSSTFRATAATTAVSFGFRNDPGFFHFDDASVVALQQSSGTPEPGSIALLLGAGMAALIVQKRRFQT